MSMRVSRCKDCDASIRFLWLPARRWIAVDAAPSNRGNVVVTRSALDEGRVLDKGETWVGNTYRQHWQTCTHIFGTRKRRVA
jgi:hypothetical protein